MKTDRKNILIKILLHLIFLCIPAVALTAFALRGLNEYYAVLDNNWFVQTCFFFAGISIACILFNLRLRFLPITIVLVVILIVIRIIISNIELFEFNTFFYLVRFKVFSTIFVTGWICGWGFSRFKNFAIIFAAVIAVIAIFITVSQSEFSFIGILKIFLPIILFAFYIVYMSSAVHNVTVFSRGRFFIFLRNLLGIILLFLLLMFLVGLLMKSTFTEIEKTWDSKTQKNEADGLLERSKDSTYKMKDRMRPNPAFGKAKDNPEPMFVAYIDNYLDDDHEIPNPLYFISHYLTNFDSFTETFEKDSIIPYSDLFQTAPSEIDLYFSQTDTAIMNVALQDTLTKIVDVDVYNINLSPKEFVAPITSFFCQPVAIENDYKTQFKSAYRSKSVVSDLNSAYFVYPSRDELLLIYQQQRYDILASVENFDDLPETFYSYYTSLPDNDFIDSLKNLTKKITAGAETPVEKIIAIRNHFFAVDELGEPVFKYTENPGIPGIPGASKLAHFLFESHKGYCAHFAGVTLFMLRVCGIPARLTVGFATVDRSDKNKGWYWFYEDQAHAWVQIYFPKFGWLDFDTTVGNDDMEESPQPDGTPPMQINKANFAGTGKITARDTINKLIDFALEKMTVNDSEYIFESPKQIVLDMTVAKILRDTVNLKFSELSDSDSGLSLSFDETLKDIKPSINTPKNEVFEMLPKPVKIDEFRIDVNKIDEQKDEKSDTDSNLRNDNKNKISIFAVCAIILVAILIFIMVLPYIIFKYYKYKSKLKSKNVNIFYIYKTSMFLLNQLQCERKNLTPLQFASTVADKKYETEFEKFMIIYLQFKYSDIKITPDEKEFINGFYCNFKNKIRKKHGKFELVKKFLNIKQTLKFYINNYGTTK
ncbi:MAG: transglutaminase-like domain-containing protein [Prevotellaceae bacterium]|nr:transglutaminase-like domain-containing protein [Prevotellaceae bacterium]